MTITATPPGRRSVPESPPRTAAAVGWNVLEGTLADVVYLSAQTRLVITLPGGSTIAVDRQNRTVGEPEPSPGEPVRVVFDPLSATLLSE